MVLLVKEPELPTLHWHQRAPITALAISPDGEGIVVGSQAGVFLARSETDVQNVLDTTLDHVHRLVFSPDGSVLAVAGGSPGEIGAVELWSWRDRTLIRTLEGHDDLVYAAEWLDDAKTLITASADRTLRVWDATTGTSLAILKGHSGPVLCLAVSSDNKIVCSGSTDQTIRVWDRTTWRLLRSLTNHLGQVNALTFVPAPSSSDDHPLSYLVSAGGDSTVRIWQPEIGRMVRIVRQTSTPLTIARHRQGTVYTGAKDGRLRAIDVETGELTKEGPSSDSWITSLVVSGGTNQVWAGDSLGRLRRVDW